MPDDVITRPAAASGMRAAFEPSSWNPETRTIDVVWTTGAPVQRMDWMSGTRFTEVLDVSPDAVDLTRLNSGAPVLDTHGSYSVQDVIGVVVDGSASVANGRGRATLRLSERDEVAGIVRDVAAGIIRNISVGYTVQRWNVEKASASKLETRTAAAWTPNELSLVPIPADVGAQTRSAPAPEPAPSPETAAQAAPQETEMTETVARAAPAAPSLDTTAIIAAERARVADIHIIARQANLPAETVATMIADGTMADAARTAALNHVAASAAPLVPAQNVQLLRDERETLVTRMADALTARRMSSDSALARTPEATPPDHAREYMGLSMHGMIRELALRSGVKNAHRWNGNELANFALQRDGGVTSASDFSAILTNSTNKYLRAIYGSFNPTWRGWTSEYEVADFKTITSAGMGNFPEPVTFPEGAPVPDSTLNDEGETFGVLERGRIVQLSRIALVNDDLRAIDRAVRGGALGGYSALRRAVFLLLTANANMADGVALFHATHANLGTPGALTATTFGELLRLLLEQTGVEGQALPPPTEVTFLVAPSKQRTAFELTSSLIVPTNTGQALPMQYRDMTTVVTEPYLKTGNDPYYLVRNDVPLVDIAYLSGDGRVPIISSEAEIEYTGISWRLMFNFGCKATNWRSGAANTG